MFDPHDFPYKDLSDSLRDFNSEDMLFTNDCSTIQNHNRDVQFTETKTGQNEICFNNDPFSNEMISDIENTELVVIHSEDILSYEPTLLDENTVNQFLIPTPKITNHDKQNQNDNNLDLLALQSCVICQQIFTTDADLLDHTISVHATDEAISRAHNLEKLKKTDCSSKSMFSRRLDTNDSYLDLETEWLVCCQCERVLSIALDMDPTDQLCCANINDKCGVAKQKLNTMYVCDFCSGLFANDDSLDKHKAVCNMNNFTEDFNESSINSDAYLKSSVCEKQVVSSDEMSFTRKTCQEINFPKSRKYSTNTQYNNTPNSKMWNCGSCNQLFVTARELYRHKRGEDRPDGAPITAYVCEECDKVLGSMCALHTHKKMHKVSKPGYPCRICGRRFNQSGHLAIHMRMHTGERPYPCDLCPKAFKVKVERDDHRRTHTGERPFACTACPKTFTAAARLREHARIHTDQRPYRCEICGAAFRRPYARTVHTLIHTGEKPHECDVCGTAFRRSGDMWKHKRTIHGTQVADTKSA